MSIYSTVKTAGSALLSLCQSSGVSGTWSLILRSNSPLCTCVKPPQLAQNTEQLSLAARTVEVQKHGVRHGLSLRFVPRHCVCLRCCVRFYMWVARGARVSVCGCTCVCWKGRRSTHLVERQLRDAVNDRRVPAPPNKSVDRKGDRIKRNVWCRYMTVCEV